MRSFSPPPEAPFVSERPFDPGRSVRTGSFDGPLPAIDWTDAARAAGHGRLWQLTHEKRWIYTAVRKGHLVVAAAIVRTGYAATALAWVWDERERGLLDERVALAPPSGARVVDTGPGARSAWFEGSGMRIAIEPTGLSLDALGAAAEGPGQRASSAVRGAPLHLALQFSAHPARPIGAIAPIPGGLANATQKHLSRASGEVLVARTARRIDGGLAAFDYTNGLLARRTRWRWALALGRAGDRDLAVNLVEGFMGELECALFLDDALVPLGEGTFLLDAHDPLRPWSIRTTCGSLDLAFEPGGLHARHEELGLVRSRFLQPVGRFRGRVSARGADLGEVDLLGVAEDQDVTW